ncbi:hypothetical protein [Laspinema palackyanum]|uniref:hypothetical protein n=1 Tax=Laspinema palackyanum TaxID=3231601 RepID=UPI00345D5899|nr:hypothetical protein [Laspinema sp. D2c]
MAGAAQRNQVFGPVVLGHPVVVMHVQGQPTPFRFGQVFSLVTGAQALATTFGATPVCLLFDG